MDKPILKKSYKGYEIAVQHDSEADSPATWGNGNICGWCRHLSVENQHVNRDTFMAMSKVPGYEQYADDAERLEKEFHVFPLDAYIHSNTVLSLHGEGRRNKWDTSDFIGCVIIGKHEAKTRKEAERIARGVVQEWNLYLNGEVYVAVVSKPETCGHCGHTSYETIESVGGIYGEPAEAMQAGREVVDALA